MIPIHTKSKFRYTPIIKFFVPLNKKKELELIKIAKIVFNYYKVPLNKINSKTRKRKIVKCRQVSHYFAKLLTKNRNTEIGWVIGKKDRVTVIHSIKVINNFLATDKKFADEIKELKKLINYGL